MEQLKSYRNGDSRVVCRFLWLPLTLPSYEYGYSLDGWKTKWLQFAKIKQQFWDDKFYDACWVDYY